LRHKYRLAVVDDDLKAVKDYYDPNLPPQRREMEDWARFPVAHFGEIKLTADAPPKRGVYLRQSNAFKL
jgi:hypothetical protein